MMITYSRLSDDRLKYLTGLDQDRFRTLIELFKRYGTVDNSICAVEEQLLLTLAKYRHNQDYIMMDNHYGLSRLAISKVFKNVTKQMYCIIWVKK